MGLTLPQTCNMGSSQTGLVGIIGVTLLNPDGTVKTARTTAGIYEIGGGAYGKNIGFDDHWIGLIVWDTGGANPYYAVTEYNLEGLSDAILEDTNELQINQGNWLTATGFSVPNEYDTELSNIQAEVNGLNGEAMRGTDLAAKASVCTELRLAELDAANLPADIAAIPTGTAIADAVLDEVVEGSYTLRQLVRGLISVLAGKTSGGGTTTLVFRDTADSKNRITATVDANKNRTAITLDLT